MATKEELLERAKELDVEGRSTMNKEELEAAVAEAEAADASDDEVVVEEAPLSAPQLDELEQEAEEEEDEEEEELPTAPMSEAQADEAADASHPRDDAGRPLLGGVRGSLKDNLGEGDDREVYEVRQEDVINFPPPLEDREKELESEGGPGNPMLWNQVGVAYTDGSVSNPTGHAYKDPDGSDLSLLTPPEDEDDE